MLMITVALALAGCNRKTIYSHYEHTPIGGWEKVDHLSFTLSPVPESGDFSEEVGLRINGAYPFRGLTLIIEQQTWPSGYMRSDTLSCNLIDEDGTILGEGISFYQYNFHVNTLRLHEGDSLHITVRHNMKRVIMPGVADVGIRLDRQ